MAGWICEVSVILLASLALAAVPASKRFNVVYLVSGLFEILQRFLIVLFVEYKFPLATRKSFSFSILFSEDAFHIVLTFVFSSHNQTDCR
jgi:hypothetical protein